MSGSGQMEAKGFFAALFDFGFTSFITLRFLKVIYILLVVLILLGGTIFLISSIVALANGEATGLFLLILAPLITLLYLVFARIWLEMIALFFRIGENTSIMAHAMNGGSSNPPPPSSSPWGSAPGPSSPGFGSGSTTEPGFGSGPENP